MLRPNGPDEYVEFRNAVVGKIVELGGSLSHHHGVGRMFAPWLEQHLGSGQMGVLRALKSHFDPDDIMNPGGTLGLDEPGRRVAAAGRPAEASTWDSWWGRRAVT